MEVEKVQLGDIYMNKTKKFLAPCLRAYGQDFKIRYDSTWKVAVGIGDMILRKSLFIHEKHLFILCDTQLNSDTFLGFLEWLRGQSHIYEDDYVFDHIRSGKLHMLVVKIPQEFHEALHNFKLGQYSTMYTPKQLGELFDKNSDVTKVLIKDHNYKIVFAKHLQEEFKVNIRAEEITDDFELELPPYWNDELFNENVKPGAE